MTSSDAATRKVPVVFRMPQAKVGRGHVLPDLCAPGASDRFVTLPRGGRTRFGMVAFAGVEVTANDMLERWRETLEHPAGEAGVLSLLSQYVAELGSLKIGTVVFVAVSEEGILRLHVSRIDHRPTCARPFPPQRVVTRRPVFFSPLFGRLHSGERRHAAEVSARAGGPYRRQPLERKDVLIR